jgi:hypothetical protein
MLNLNPTTLQAVADKALVDAAAHPRWIAAIGRALLELDTNPWIERGELHGLVIGSPSGKLYSANGECQCEAYAHGRACWHRAAARLVRLHDEAQQHRALAAAARARQAAEPIICQQPDNLCELHNPCVEHADQAAAYLQQERPTVAKLIAAARAKAQMDELFA